MPSFTSNLTQLAALTRISRKISPHNSFSCSFYSASPFSLHFLTSSPTFIQAIKMAAQRRKEEAEAFKLATQQALICAPASPIKPDPQRLPNSDSNDSNNDQNCHFMRLSPEIRSRIYCRCFAHCHETPLTVLTAYAMDNDFHASLDPISSRYPDAVKIRSKTPALMRTCSPTRTEAGAIWYSQTIFIYRLDAVSCSSASEYQRRHC